MIETKEDRNARVQARYDELMAEAKHGHYETLFRVVREEVEREREACAQAAHRVMFQMCGYPMGMRSLPEEAIRRRTEQ